MKLTISKTVQEEKEITLPIFFKTIKNYIEYFAAFSTTDQRRLTIFNDGSYSTLTWTDDFWLKSNLEKVISEGKESTEEEFMTAWESALQSLSFKATLIEKAEA